MNNLFKLSYYIKRFEIILRKWKFGEEKIERTKIGNIKRSPFYFFIFVILCFISGDL